MEIYSTEEQQVEAIKSFWKENGSQIIVGAVLGLGGFSGVISSVLTFSFRLILTNSNKCRALGSVNALLPEAMSRCITNRRLMVIADPTIMDIAYLTYIEATSYC